jgi:hypothetical protein
MIPAAIELLCHHMDRKNQGANQAQEDANMPNIFGMTNSLTSIHKFVLAG